MTTAIADYALVSDRHCAALVSRYGSVDWLCFPRFDSPATFARLLGQDAGHWTISPIGIFEAARRYVEGTMVLETTFRTATGTVVLTDALAVGQDNTGHQLGTGSPHLLIRRLACTEGTVPMEITFDPRPEYGLVTPILCPVDGGLASRGGADSLVLTSPIPLTPDAGGAYACPVLEAGAVASFALHWSTPARPPARTWTQAELDDRLAGTVAGWRSWSEPHQTYQGPFRELVLHSGRVLQALSYQPSGALLAAATTSLPERTGGERNWDYRHSWVRAASLAMSALRVAACPDEACDFFGFLVTAAPSLGRDRVLRIVFGIGGEHDLTERPLDHLGGWRESRPVRVGNDACNQVQIDVYGELLEAACRLSDQLGDLDDPTRRFLLTCADCAAERWRDSDHGIWETRGEARHFVSSKVMCWVALDRAIALADLLGAGVRVEWWRQVRDEIAQAVLRHGWNSEVGAFTQAFGSTELDASVLMIPILGFLPADDPRVLSTIDVIEDELTDEHGLVYRYRAQAGVDGLSGPEGTFLPCTFWLAQALAIAGRPDRARYVFERASRHANDVGLFAEEVDPVSRELLGNFPHAFSHLGLVNAAQAIAEAECRVGAGPPPSPRSEPRTPHSARPAPPFP